MGNQMPIGKLILTEYLITFRTIFLIAHAKRYLRLLTKLTIIKLMPVTKDRVEALAAPE